MGLRSVQQTVEKFVRRHEIAKDFLRQERDKALEERDRFEELAKRFHKQGEKTLKENTILKYKYEAAQAALRDQMFANGKLRMELEQIKKEGE